jgi:hypothetical protein
MAQHKINAQISDVGLKVNFHWIKALQLVSLVDREVDVGVSQVK